jgi:hypothetical protein
MKVIFEQEYDGESIVDLERDISECFDERFNPLVKDLPDEYGIVEGTFKVTITWYPE